ncbi:MAG: cadherin-like beta sandwich domain-containing protein, partial [Oscillospiraceae bacterium]
QGQEFKTLYIKTTAENETDSEVYAFRITRAKPNDQTLLEKLVLKDQNKAVIPFDFTLDGVNFSKDVPYEVTDVIFNILPVSKDVGKITIKYEDERSVTAGNDSIPYKLKDSNTTAKFVIKVTAQDTTKTKEYTFSIRRLPPANDCLLKDLILGDSEKFAPPFTPSQLNYKAEVAKGKKEVTLTPITHNDKATIKINGAPAKSGEAFKVDVLEIKTKILVEVTAQNGRDRKTYKIDMLNPNLQNKSSNADLDFLEVDNGVLDPPFSPSITTYNVAVKDDVAYVSLNAQAADSLAQMTMFSDSREVGDANGNLKEYIPEGQTGFKIEVISPDSTKTKEYTINVFRKDETNSGTLKPISAEEVNFDVSGDVVVDISKYPIVSSEIFETIKKKHPDKSITFVGNDYSLQFKGSDLSKLNIP